MSDSILEENRLKNLKQEQTSINDFVDFCSFSFGDTIKDVKKVLGEKEDELSKHLKSHSSLVRYPNFSVVYFKETKLISCLIVWSQELPYDLRDTKVGLIGKYKNEIIELFGNPDRVYGSQIAYRGKFKFLEVQFKINEEDKCYQIMVVWDKAYIQEQYK